MKKIKTFLFAILAAISLSSCALDSASFGVNPISYPTQRGYAPVHVPAIYHTTRCYPYDVRPDWMRYGGNWVPTRRHHRHY